MTDCVLTARHPADLEALLAAHAGPSAVAAAGGPPGAPVGAAEGAAAWGAGGAGGGGAGAAGAGAGAGGGAGACLLTLKGGSACVLTARCAGPGLDITLRGRTHGMTP